MEDIQNYPNLLSSLLLVRGRGVAQVVGGTRHLALRRQREGKAKHGVSENAS